MLGSKVCEYVQTTPCEHSFSLKLWRACLNMLSSLKMFCLRSGDSMNSRRGIIEECSAVIQRKLPAKLKDPGSFYIPCNIGTNFNGKALCDLGASINLMPLAVFNQLGLGEPRPTTVTLLLADRSISRPRGIIEDVLVKVDKFIFPRIL
ncbi:hypothetical protein K1719_041350 [Acacia pycnantha]|nr:hypothetical protein K1719_041350 [Acacia pycnantha]